VYATACEFFFGEVVSLSQLVETASTGVGQETSKSSQFAAPTPGVTR
jgi:hypothetical protein